MSSACQVLRAMGPGGRAARLTRTSPNPAQEPTGSSFGSPCASGGASQPACQTPDPENGGPLLAYLLIVLIYWCNSPLSFLTWRIYNI